MKPTTAIWMLAGALLAAGAAYAQSRERTGEEIVKQQCARCHQAGVSGAPRIDDRAAWIPRMKQGVDATVRAAAKGHGGMPARGGMADLTDTELRAAILYMFYPALAAARAPAAPAGTARNPNLRVVGGIEIYLGIMLADAVRTQQPKPQGKDYYHVNITLHDSSTRAHIKDAQVEARVANPVTGGEKKKLLPMTIHDDGSYGNYFRMSGVEPYTITVEVRLPQAAHPLEAKFDFKR